MAYEKIILKKENSDDKLYPRTLASELINDDESTFTPQAKLEVGEGIAITNNTVRANLAINGQGPVLQDGVYQWNLDEKNRTIDAKPTLNNTEHLVSSDGVARYTLQRIPMSFSHSFEAKIEAAEYGTLVEEAILKDYATFVNNLPGDNDLSEVRIYVAIGNNPYLKISTCNGTVTNGMIDSAPGLSVRYKNSDSTIVEDDVATFFFAKGRVIDATSKEPVILADWANIKVIICCDGYVS